MGVDEEYNKLKELAGVLKLFKKMEEDEDWENPHYRLIFGKFLFGDVGAFSGVSTDVYRMSVNKELKEKMENASKDLYNILPEIIKKITDEKGLYELAEVMGEIPPPEKVQISKDLEEIKEYHKKLFEINTYTLEKYTELLKSIGAPDAAYIASGSRKLGERMLKEEIEAAKNFLIGILKKIWKKYKK